MFKEKRENQYSGAGVTWGQWEMEVLSKGLYDVTNILKSAPAAMGTVDWGLGVWGTGGFLQRQG